MLNVIRPGTTTVAFMLRQLARFSHFPTPSFSLFLYVHPRSAQHPPRVAFLMARPTMHQRLFTDAGSAYKYRSFDGETFRGRCSLITPVLSALDWQLRGFPTIPRPLRRDSSAEIRLMVEVALNDRSIV